MLDFAEFTRSAHAAYSLFAPIFFGGVLLFAVSEIAYLAIVNARRILAALRMERLDG